MAEQSVRKKQKPGDSDFTELGPANTNGASFEKKWQKKFFKSMDRWYQPLVLAMVLARCSKAFHLALTRA